MGKVLSVLSRPLRNYNVGNRAIKQISQEKRKPAPRHPSTLKHLQETIDSPTSKEAVKIPEEHLTRLKEVYVKSEDKTTGESEARRRKLPENRGIVLDPEFGYMEPTVIPDGKLSIRQALELITRHQGDPNQWTPQVIAKEYKLDLGMTQQILLFFRAYDMWQPPKEKDPQKLQDQTKKYVLSPKPPLPQIK